MFLFWIAIAARESSDTSSFSLPFDSIQPWNTRGGSDWNHGRSHWAESCVQSPGLASGGPHAHPPTSCRPQWQSFSVGTISLFTVKTFDMAGCRRTRTQAPCPAPNPGTRFTDRFAPSGSFIGQDRTGPQDPSRAWQSRTPVVGETRRRRKRLDSSGRS